MSSLLLQLGFRTVEGERRYQFDFWSDGCDLFTVNASAKQQFSCSCYVELFRERVGDGRFSYSTSSWQAYPTNEARGGRNHNRLLSSIIWWSVEERTLPSNIISQRQRFSFWPSLWNMTTWWGSCVATPFWCSSLMKYCSHLWTFPLFREQFRIIMISIHKKISRRK